MEERRPLLSSDYSQQSYNSRTTEESRSLSSNSSLERCIPSSVSSNDDQDHEQDEADDTAKKPSRPGQIFALCCAAVTEPVACFCIFPFIGEMVQRTGGIREADVGFCAGAIESLFSVVQMVLMIPYGQVSDLYGRKPVLVFSLFGLSVSTMLFGLARSLVQMVLLRCLAGCFAGSVLTVRVMVSESCTKATEARAFAWFMFARNLGIFLGPVIGGLFVNVDLFAGRGPTQTYPYFSATLAAGGMCLCGTFLIAVFCEETLEITKGSSAPSMKSSMTTSELVRQPGVLSALLVFGYTMFLALANTAVLPVFLFTSIDNGGFGFSPQWISYFLAGLAACQGLWTLACFPPLTRKLGTHRIMQLCAASWPVLFASFILLNELLRRGYLTAFWASIGIPLIVGGGIAMSFAGAQLLVNSACPSPAEMAHINALTQTLNSAVRAVTPAIFTSVYALGTRRQILHGHLCWTVLAVLAIPLSMCLYRRSYKIL